MCDIKQLMYHIFQQAAMQTCENKGADVYTNGSAGHVNGTDLTRMKEVEFDKNPSEPMVNYLPLHTRLHKFIFMLLIPPHGSLPQGVTLKLNANQRCTVARILHGGMIHRQGN